MIFGIPKEIKTKDDRVSITPQGVKLLVDAGHKVIVEKSAGIGSGFTDEEYKQSGAMIANTPEDVYSLADFLIKVKGPLPSEYSLLKKNQIIFSFLHLAVEETLTKELLDKRITSIACETIENEDGELPLLIPMSEVAGKMSVQIAANLLENRNNGSGILLGGIPGVPAGKVLIIGAGHVGINAAKVAVGMGANVSILDTDPNALRRVDDLLGSKVKTYFSHESTIKELITDADVVIGAVLIPGHKAPCLVTEEMVKSMRRGSVIVDISINQGGIVETMDRITTIDNPSYERHGVIHYGVTNIPGSVARTSTIALVNESIKYLKEIAEEGILNSIKKNKALAKGVNTYNGKLTNKGAAEALNLEYTELSSIIGF